MLILVVVLTDAVRWLREAGVEVQREDSPAGAGRSSPRLDAVLGVSSGKVRVRFAAEEKGRAPYPNEIPNLERQRAALSEAGQPLLVVPFVPDAVGRVLVAAGWSWADAHGNFDLRAPNFVARQRRTTRGAKPKRRRLPQGSGSLAIIRALIRAGVGEDEAGAVSALAALARVTQPRASQVLRQLEELSLVKKTGRGRWRPDHEALLDRFLADYSGPGGSEEFLYSLDSPTDVAVKLARVGGPGNPVVVSADVGPDVVIPWRRPTVVVVYAHKGIDAGDVGVVEAQGRDDANVIVRTPADRSVFPVPGFAAELHGVDMPLADPSQMIWDLQELGGADRLEGAGMLREWLLKRP